MNTKQIPRRYDLVEILQEHRGPMTADALAAQLDLSSATVWTYIQLLTKEQLVWKGGKKIPTVRLTPTGLAWTRKPHVEDLDVPRYPCGHIRVDSTCFCLKCHNTDRWKEYQTIGSRYYTASMKDGR
jgi:hypothetical protein